MAGLENYMRSQIQTKKAANAATKEDRAPIHSVLEVIAQAVATDRTAFVATIAQKVSEVEAQGDDAPAYLTIGKANEGKVPGKGDGPGFRYITFPLADVTADFMVDVAKTLVAMKDARDKAGQAQAKHGKK